MTSLQAAALWIGLNTLFLAYISMRVGQARMKTKTDLGDGGHPEMIRAIRAQGNYVEYAWAALLGLFLLAMLGASSMLIHALGAIFLLARIFHLLDSAWACGRRAAWSAFS